MHSLPFTRDLVLIGGGHTHALVLRRWGMRPLPGARLTVINPGPVAAYSGMLPGFVAGHYRRDELDIDLHRLAAFAGARMVEGIVRHIDPEARRIDIDGRPPIVFDVASVNVGVTAAMPWIPGFAEHGVPAKPLGPLAERWEAYLGTSGPARVAVVGGGVAGAELTMAMAFRLRDLGREAELRIVDRGRALAEATPRGRRLLLRAMQGLGIELIEDAEVVAAEPGLLRLADGRQIASDFSVEAAGARAWDWLGASGLASKDGFLTVDRFLRTSNHVIFAAGDCAHMADSPRPKAGVFAVRQAPVLHDNLRATLSGGRLTPYQPQRSYLKLVSMGAQTALAEKWGGALAGPPFWRWKDWIDRRFMRRLNRPPVMAPPPLPPVRAQGLDELGATAMCGGCGAKVGRRALRTVLGDAPGDDAAILEAGGVRQVISTDHLRAVTADPVLMARIAAVHALGDVWAMGAEPEVALASIVLPRMSPELQERTLAEIMAAATAVIAEAGAKIVGGHTSMGAEMTLGFTVIGRCPREPIGLGGAKDGDVLLLTKPLGTGTILAAAMAGQAPAHVLSGCLAAMIVPQGAASRALAMARAMTDVTGFGLAGHLAGICNASGVAAEIDLAALPLLPGAEALAAAGVRSSLWGDNRGGAGPVVGATGPRGDLLFDPQTAGGLLAAVPEPDAAAALAALRGLGYPAARIGRIVTGEPSVICLP